MKILLGLVSAALVSGVVGEARAQEPEPVDNYFPNRLSGWRFQFEPFGVLPVDVNGVIQIRDLQVPFSSNLSDIVDHLDFALPLRFEAWKKQWGIIINTQRYWLSANKTLGEMSLNLDSRITFGQVSIAHRFGAFNINDDVSLSVDADVGAWVGRLHNTIEMSDGSSRSESQTFPKAALSMRPILRITPTWAIIGRGMITFPDNSWTAMLGGEYDWKWLGVEFGYLTSRIVLDDNRVTLATNLNGPYVGIAFRWGAGDVY